MTYYLIHKMLVPSPQFLIPLNLPHPSQFLNEYPEKSPISQKKIFFSKKHRIRKWVLLEQFNRKKQYWDMALESNLSYSLENCTLFFNIFQPDSRVLKRGSLKFPKPTHALKNMSIYFSKQCFLVKTEDFA